MTVSGCVSYVGGVVDVVECGLLFESGWVGGLSVCVV